MRRAARLFATAGALAALAFAPSAHAQDAAPAPDQAKLQLARQLVQAMGGDDDAEDQLDAVFDAVQKTVEDRASTLDSGLAGAFLDGLKQQIAGLAPQVVALSVQLYAETCSEKELRDMLAFQQSDTGRSMARKQPLIRAQVLHQTLPLVSGKLPDIMDKAADQACARVQCSAQDRKTLGNVLSGPPQALPDTAPEAPPPQDPPPPRIPPNDGAVRTPT